jgi:hypothetical protein
VGAKDSLRLAAGALCLPAREESREAARELVRLCDILAE